jgi:hypothetical protein
MSEVERRRTLRFPMSLPVSVVTDDSTRRQIQGVTCDVSSSGMTWFSTSKLAVETAVIFTLELPSEVTLADPVQARCRGHVVRVESQPDRCGFVVAVHLDRFEFVGVRSRNPEIHIVR